MKPHEKMLEIELDLNTTNDNYSKAKGEQFALNVDGKTNINYSALSLSNKQAKETKYYRSNLMDKTVFTSTNGIWKKKKFFYCFCFFFLKANFQFQEHWIK